MTSNLQDTTGPFVTRVGDEVEYLGELETAGGFRWVFRLPSSGLVNTTRYGAVIHPDDPRPFDIFLAPKEPKTVFVNWYADGPRGGYHDSRAAADSHERTAFGAGSRGRKALVQFSDVDDQGVPVDGSTVRRVDL